MTFHFETEMRNYS